MHILLLQYKKTPLRLASQFGHSGIVKILLDAGATVDTKSYVS